PKLCVVAGPEYAVAGFERQAQEEQVATRRLETSHAFHSLMMDPMLDRFAAELREIEMLSPRIPFLSNVTGTWITAEQAIDPDYWVRHVRSTVLFGEGIANLLKADPDWAALEVGPGHTLGRLSKQQVKLAEGCVIATTMRAPSQEVEDDEHLLECIAQLWVS